MEEKCLHKLRELQKYLKFLEYRIAHNAQNQVKFIQIRDWLKNEPSNLSLGVLGKIERSIIQQFRNCIKEKRLIPEEFRLLFQNGQTNENPVIDLDQDEDIQFVSEVLHENKENKGVRNGQKPEQEDEVELVSVDILLRPEERTYNNNARENHNLNSNIICIDDDSLSGGEEGPVTSKLTCNTVGEATTGRKPHESSPITAPNDVPTTIPEIASTSRPLDSISPSTSSPSNDFNSAKTLNQKHDFNPASTSNFVKDLNSSSTSAHVQGFDSSSTSTCPLFFRREKQLNGVVGVTHSKQATTPIQINDNICTVIPAPVYQQSSAKPNQTHLKIRMNDPRIAKKLKMLNDCPLRNLLASDGQNHLVLAPVQQNQIKLASPTRSNVANVNISESGKDQTARTYGEYRRLKENKAKEELQRKKDLEKAKEAEHPKEQLEENPKTSINKTKEIKRNKSPSSKTDRAIKELECTVKGYDSLKDYFTLNGKRFSSIKARFNIAEQLNETENTFGKRSRSMPRYDEIGPEEPQQKKKRCKSVCELSDDDIDSTDSQNSFNIYEHINKRKKLNDWLDDIPETSISLVKPCSVLLERLPQEILNKYMKKQVDYNENVELVEGMIMIEEAEKIPNSIPTQIKIPNTNITMTESSARTCVLCKVKTKYLTGHYIRAHKSESYVSRLSEEDLLYLTVNIPFAIPITPGRTSKYNMKYEVTCGFCNQKITQPFQKLFEHYSKHTGEYAYECYGCGQSFPDIKESTRHRNKSKACKNYEVKTVYLYPEHLKTIHLYCCKICNFLQLNEANTFKHLRDHHFKRGDDPACIEKIILCAMDVSALNCEDMGIMNQDKNINVGNEPLTEDPYQQENSNDDMDLDTFRMQSPCTFMDELLREECGDDYEIDIKPDIDTLDQLVSLNEIKKETSCDDRAHLDQHQPITVKIENVTAMKARNTYKTHDHSLMSFGLLKCMATDCNFTTNNDDEMLQHLKEHLNSMLPPSNLLECSYCYANTENLSSPEMLIKHVREKHATSRFQCSECHYRSCVASNVFVHFQMYHPTQKECSVIYVCNGPIVESSQRVDYLTHCWMNNVKKLNCPFCPQQYFTHALMEEHCKNMHKNEDINKLKFKLYACIYCNCEIFNKVKVQQHIALKHPDEFNFACERNSSKNNKEDLLANLRLYDITVMNYTGEIRSVDEEVRKEEENIVLKPVKDEKPVKEELFMTQCEIVKATLRKLNKNTGVPPDRLHICPKMNCCAVLSNFETWTKHMTYDHGFIMYKCPHCNNYDESNDSTTFENHLKQHCLHTYICFHCGETFPDEPSIIMHFDNMHKEVSEYRFERLQVNPKYCYFIGISVELHEDKFTFLCELQDMLLRRIDKLKEDAANQLRSSWPVSLTNDVFEDYPNFVPKYIHTCISGGCSFRTRNYDQLLEHMKTHSFLKRHFTCNKCNVKFLIGTETDRLISHINMHTSSKVHMCNICSAVFGTRVNLYKHVHSMHSKRDVFMITLNRTSNGKLLELNVMFAMGRKTFTTIPGCFCCTTQNIDFLAIHLREKHKIVLNYFCAVCNKKLPSLQSSDGHFKEEHADKDFQLYASLSSCSDIELISINPLQLDVVDSNNGAEGKVQTDENEINDSDILAIYEGDDLIITEEIRDINTIQAKSPSKIKCIEMTALETLTEKTKSCSVAETNMSAQSDSTAFTIGQTKISVVKLSNPSVQQIPKENTAIPANSTRNQHPISSSEQVPILNTRIGQPSFQQSITQQVRHTYSTNTTLPAGPANFNTLQHNPVLNTTPRQSSYVLQQQQRPTHSLNIPATISPARMVSQPKMPALNTKQSQPYYHSIQQLLDTNTSLPARPANFIAPNQQTIQQQQRPTYTRNNAASLNFTSQQQTPQQQGLQNYNTNTAATSRPVSFTSQQPISVLNTNRCQKSIPQLQRQHFISNMASSTRPDNQQQMPVISTTQPKPYYKQSTPQQSIPQHRPHFTTNIAASSRPDNQQQIPVIITSQPQRHYHQSRIQPLTPFFQNELLRPVRPSRGGEQV